MIDSRTEHHSEKWLLERTYHAQLLNGQDLSVPRLTRAMKEIADFYVPISTWQEISQYKANTFYQQGIPILLYKENMWEHQRGNTESWGPNKNMRAIIFGDAKTQTESDKGTSDAVYYLDRLRGNASNASWKLWFPFSIDRIFDASAPSPFTFFSPRWQFQYTTHYTIITPDGHNIKYADHTTAVQGFQTFQAHKETTGSNPHRQFPQFCYYHEVTCSDGIYRIEFFGPHMNEPGELIQRK